MRLRLTVAVPDLTRARGSDLAPALHELEVEARQGTTAGQLAGALAAHLGTTGAALRAASTAVTDDAVLGVAPLVDGAALTLLPVRRPVDGAPGAPREGTPLALAVAHGPDAGHRVPLTAGRLTLGRSAEADVRLDDPRLSRVHAAVETGPDGIRIADLGSTNGTWLNERRVDREAVGLTGGATVAVGDSRLKLRASGAVPAACTPRPDGTRVVNRRPRAGSVCDAPAIALPAPPEPPHRTRIPWVAMVVPIPVAAVLAVFLGPTMLAFALMSPLLLAGTALGDRLGGRREYAARLAEHARSLGAALARVEAACADERRERRHALPDPAEVLTIATGPSARVWERRSGDDDALVVSVGSCTAPAGVRVIRPRGDEGPEHPALEGVPCTVRLSEVGVLGVSGSSAATRGAARNLLGQLAVLHSPHDLDIVSVVASAEAAGAWSWLGRLPHTRHPDGSQRRGAAAVQSLDPEGVRAAVAGLVAKVRERGTTSGAATGAWKGPRTVLLLDGAAALRGVPGLAEVMASGPAVGVCCIALAEEAAQLPAEARAVLDLGRADSPVLAGCVPAVDDLLVDRVGPWWADRVSRALAPLRDATPLSTPSDLPDSIALGDVSAVDVGDPSSIAAAWADRPWQTAVPVGAAQSGAHRLDLATDGPHVLVAGTTGSGKSELLRALVVSLAAHNRPEHLSFVLIDYKGGAAFRECAELPHTAGVVTDLDDRLAERALTSLRAELRRRERVLAEAGVTDHAGYLETPASRDEPLPRLVVVVDEFRALAEELPDFVDGMVRLAALGRSLGVHLVMATQRPAGVVTADIKANLNLRIALRVRDRTDSDDVIDCADAAAIDPRTPGRALSRTGDGSLTAFQAAHLGAAWTAPAPAGIEVHDVRWGAPRAHEPVGEVEHRHPSELARVVAAVTEACQVIGARPAARAWLPPLPPVVEGLGPEPSSPGHRAAIGLVDRPDRQVQEPLVLDLREPGLWGVVGAPGSGRTTALLALARSLAAELDPSQLHVYAVSGGGLATLEDLPHCGAHVEHGDLGRLERLVARLATEVAGRRRALSASGCPTFEEWRRSTPSPSAHVLVLVDDWDLLLHQAESVEHAGLTDRLLGLLREGEAVGLKAVLAGERALLVGRVASALTHRVLLRLADRADAALAGMGQGCMPVDPPPGRGVLADGAEVQLALPPDATPRQPCGTGPAPLRVEALPTHVDAALLTSHVRAAGAPDTVVLGVGGDDLTVLGLAAASDGRRWLVAGPAGSGVSTTVALAARQLLDRGRRTAVVSARPGPLDVLRAHPDLALWCDPAAPAALARLWEEVPDLVVVVDDADQLLDLPVEPVLRDIARTVDSRGGLVVCGASSTTLATQYRGLALDIARERTGVLLGPAGIADADLFGLRLRAERGAPPGRGHLVRRGRAVPVQVALPGPPATAGQADGSAA